MPTPALLITGASTGIGLACVQRFDARGWRVFAGVRRAADAERLRAGCSPRVTQLLLDVTDQATIAAAAEQVEAAVGGRGLDALVNNAGIALIGPLEFVALEDFRRVLEVNVTGQLAVTQRFLPLVRQARGRIVNMGSISGRIASPFVGPYCTSKFALEALTDSLRQEVAHFGIEVAIVEPGMIATPIWEKGEREAEERRAAYPPAAEELYGWLLARFERLVRPAIRRAAPVALVADAVEHAVTSPEPRTRYLVGKDARVRLMLKSLLSDRAMDRLVRTALTRTR